jgi:Arm DNA-binding domain
MELEKLSALRVKRASKPGLYGDGHGLYLRVGDGNAKSWVLRYMLSGVAHSMGIGAVADFSLAEARERAAKYRKLAKQGIDPIEARRAERTGSSARAITFAACAEAYIANHKAAWKGARHAKQWTSSLEAYACPALGGLPGWIWRPTCGDRPPSAG